jgi:predicted PurR-regulated permease PerM
MVEYLPRLTERGQRWVRFLGLLAVTALLVWIALVLRRVLTPIVAALALAYILNPLVTTLELRYRVRRVISISCGLALLLVVGASLLIAATAQVVQLAGDVPQYAERTFDWIDRTVPGLFSTTAEQAPGVTADQPSTAPPDQDGRGPRGVDRNRLIELASQHGLSLGQAVIGYIGRIASDIFYWLSLVVLLPLYTFFFLLRFNQIVQIVQDHLPAAGRPTVVRVVTTIDGAISGFFRGRLLICLAVGTLTGLGWLCVGVPYNLALGALAGTLNLIPFMSVFSLVPALILTYLQAAEAGGNWLLATSLVIVVYAIVQAIESFVLTPTIQAKASGLHPITTVIALLIGGQLAGLLGMLLAIPIASTLKSLVGEYVLPEVRRLANLKPGGPPDMAKAAASSTTAVPLTEPDERPPEKQP